MLVPTSAGWRGTDGSCFTTAAAFRDYLVGQQFTNWRPSNICLHNTASPNLAQWNATVAGDDPLADARQRLLNLTSYYQGLGWQGQPHLYITDKLIIVGNPLNKRGTHSTCFNATHWGIEMVGDFNAEPFNPAIRDLTVQAIAVMCSVSGIDPALLNFHKDCTADQHDCPGKFVVKPEVISLVRAAMAGGDAHSHPVTTTPPTPAVVTSYPLSAAYGEAAVKALQAALNGVGVRNSDGRPITVDGWSGQETDDAITALAAKVKQGASP